MQYLNRTTLSLARKCTKKSPAEAGLLNIIQQVLELNDIGCGGTLGTVDNVEGYPGAFLQRLETLGLNCGMMYEYILAAILLNKTKTL